MTSLAELRLPGSEGARSVEPAAMRHTSVGAQTFSKRFITFAIAFRIGSECPFIERLVLVKRFLNHF